MTIRTNAREALVDLAADSPLTYPQIRDAGRAGTLAALLATLTSAQRVAAAAVYAERRQISISDALGVFGRLMDASPVSPASPDAVTCQAAYAAERAEATVPACDICAQPLAPAETIYIDDATCCALCACGVASGRLTPAVGQLGRPLAVAAWHQASGRRLIAVIKRGPAFDAA